jgi:hypothetical protein
MGLAVRLLTVKALGRGLYRLHSDKCEHLRLRYLAQGLPLLFPFSRYSLCRILSVTEVLVKPGKNVYDGFYYPDV